MENNTLILGDSFVYGAEHNDVHWLGKLIKYYALKVDDLSLPGTGPLYVIDKFLTLENEGNISHYQNFIFSWSEATRLYHPDLPQLNISEVQNKHSYDKKNRKIYKTASLWYDYFIDLRIECIKTEALMFWFDNYLKKNYSNATVWHFFSWPSSYDNSFENLKSLTAPPFHTFEKGVNVLPSLISISLIDYSAFEEQIVDKRPGHLEGWKHDFVFESIKNIRNYQDDKILQMPIENIDSFRK